MPTVLFLCTGNYYRSRFAEHVFNSLSEQNGGAWRADSRALNPSPYNYGPISKYCLAGLTTHGYCPPENPRFPQRLSVDDLESADLVVAVKEAEHRPLMRQNFPTWENGIEYWHVHDLDVAEPEIALPGLLDLVKRLYQRLAAC